MDVVKWSRPPTRIPGPDTPPTRFFKMKFQPELRPMYLIYPDESTLAEIGIAIARAYMPDATLKDWAVMTLDMVKPKAEEASKEPAHA